MAVDRNDVFLGVLAAVLYLISVQVPADTAGDDAARCDALKNEDFSLIQDAPTQVTSAMLVAAAKDSMPAYCQVLGYVAPQVGFEIRLPSSSWNKKLLMVGCGGMCGELWSERGVCDRPLRRGYACLVTDMGHKGRSVGDGLWAYNNLQAEVDFGYRGTHVAALAGKAIAERHYRSAPGKSYFMGCSTGGRQALVEAQRFPWDFDGIIAGAPPTYSSMFMSRAVDAVQGPGGDPVLPPPAIQLIHKTVMAKCDLNDGVKDGILGNPSACQFDPSELLCRSGRTEGCLMQAQVQAARVVYGEATAPYGEEVRSGAAKGSELNWIRSYGGWVKEHMMTAYRYLRFMPDPGPDTKVADVDLDRDYKRTGLMDALNSSSNPDLRKFKAAGGKLIVYSGWNDELIVPGPVIDYYETVERTMGGREKTADFFRLFMLPGVNHCSGGVGADAVDFLGSLEAWVERGQAPERILSAHVKEAPAGSAYPYRQLPDDLSTASFTRPVYPYPAYAKYKGEGDSNDAANFLPIHP